MKLHIQLIYIFIWGTLLSCSSSDKDLKVEQYVNPLIQSIHQMPCSAEAALPFGGIRVAFQKTTDDLFSFALYPASRYNRQNLSPLRYIPVLTQPGKGMSPENFVREVTRHDTIVTETAKPGYYGAKISNGIKTECAATERCCIMYYQYPDSSSHGLLLDLTPVATEDSTNICLWKVNDRSLEGYYQTEHKGHENTLFFVIQFSQDCQIMAGKDTFEIVSTTSRYSGNGCYVWIDFGQNTNRILVKSSISTVNIEGAAANLNKEISHWSFDKVEHDAQQTWKRELQKIKLEGGNEEQKKIFYTSFYYSLFTPCITSDVNGNYKGTDNQIHSAADYVHYETCPQWKTLEDIPPLLAITQKKRIREILKSSYNTTRFALEQDTSKEEIFSQRNRQYVMSEVGIHDLNNRKQEFEINSSCFNKIILRTAPDKRFIITKDHPSEKQTAIRELQLNKRTLDRTYVTLKEIMHGGKLKLITDKK